jgi:hypothetical protein
MRVHVGQHGQPATDGPAILPLHVRQLHAGISSLD